MKMKSSYDMIILGGGPAGYTAALYGARAGLSVLVLEKMAPGGQMALTDVIDNYPGFDQGIDGFTLGQKMQAGAARFGAVTQYAEVLNAELSGDVKKIVTSSGDFYGRTVVLATGANPRRLGLPEEESLVGKGVHYCAHCDGRFYQGKTVVVVGGGNSAVSDALYLSHLAEKVYLIHRRDTLRAAKIYQDPLFAAENVEILWNSTVSEILTDKRVIGVTVKNLGTNQETALSADGVFVSIGRSPASELFRGEIALDDGGYVIADESTKTNVEGVFAAGDIRQKALRQVVTAVSDGAVAAHFAEEYVSLLK